MRSDRKPLNCEDKTPSGRHYASRGYGDDMIFLKDGTSGFGFLGRSGSGSWVACVWADQENFRSPHHDVQARDIAYLRLYTKGGYTQLSPEQHIKQVATR